MVRRRIPLKKIGDKSALLACFSKRRSGLFKKAGDLSHHGYNVAAVTFSPGGKPFSFGHPSADAVALRFLEADPAVMAVEARKEVKLKSEQLWWEEAVDGLGMEELLERERLLVELRRKVIERANYLMVMKPLSLGSLYIHI